MSRERFQTGEEGAKSEEAARAAYAEQEARLRKKVNRLAKEAGLLRVRRHFSKQAEIWGGRQPNEYGSPEEMQEKIKKKDLALTRAQNELLCASWAEDDEDPNSNAYFVKKSDLIRDTYELSVDTCTTIKDKYESLQFYMGYLVTFSQLTLLKTAIGIAQTDISGLTSEQLEQLANTGIHENMNLNIEVIKVKQTNAFHCKAAAIVLEKLYGLDGCSRYITQPRIEASTAERISEYNALAAALDVNRKPPEDDYPPSWKSHCLFTIPEPVDPRTYDKELTAIAKKCPLNVIISTNTLISFVTRELKEKGILPFIHEGMGVIPIDGE